jgi:molybdopterin converting factor small subunit
MPRVLIPTPLRSHTDGRDTVEGQGDSVGVVLLDVVAHYPGLKDRLFDGDDLRRFVNVYVNNEDIRFLDDLQTAVASGDEISIIPAIAGG